MLKDVDQKPITKFEISTFTSRGFEHEEDKQNNKCSKKPWYDYYKWSLAHKRGFQKIHGKPQNLKKNSSNERHPFQVNNDDQGTQTSLDTLPLTKEQLKQL